MPDILYITGADRHIFGSICCLLASFRHRLPGHKLWVADFGLLPEQRHLLDMLDVLLPMPEAVRAQFPPEMSFDKPELGTALYCKASLLEYAREKPFDALIWIDADMMVAGDLAPAAQELAARMKESGKIFAAAPALPLTDFEKLLSDVAPIPTYSLEPFARRLNELGIGLQNRYINSGFFVAADRDALARWRYLTCTTERHMLFEQNAFNLTLYLQPEKFELLDVARWNLNNYMLEETASGVAGGFPFVRHRDTEVLLAHATSNRAVDFFVNEPLIAAQGREMRFRMKFFGKPELRVLQEFYLRDFLAFAGEEAMQAGLAQEPARASA